MGDEVRVIEKCRVGPPLGSLPSPTTLPLTFFDIPWLVCPSIQHILFYHFPHPTDHFLQTTLPTLKHSLSLTLQHFFPFASNIIFPPNSDPYIRYLEGDSLSFTVAESHADFHLLVSDDSQPATNWHPLVPTLSPPPTENDGTRVIPLMAIQVTLLPNFGLSLCLTLHHATADGKSALHFIKYWASLSKANGNIINLPITTTLPLHERDKVKDPKDFKLIYLRELSSPPPPPPQDSISDVHHDVNANINKIVRATVVLSGEQVEKLKKWMTVALTCNGYVPRVSTFVATCSLIWVSLIKSEEIRKCDDEQLCYLIFGADCRDHPQLSLPSNYFGNCLTCLMASVKRNELVGTTNNKNGMIVAANAIERIVKDFKNDALIGAETLMSRFRDMVGHSVLSVSGSPSKLGMYDTDFGWGKPKKSGCPHLDRLGSFLLSDCRDSEGGVEVGLALERTAMAIFLNILQQQLDNILLT